MRELHRKLLFEVVVTALRLLNALRLRLFISRGEDDDGPERAKARADDRWN